MSRPTRTTAAGRAYLDLQNLAHRTNRPTDELHQTYALECFLARLSRSSYADTLVLKGGVLLAALDVRRPTRDVDFLARDVSNDLDRVLAMVTDIAGISIDDGLDLDLSATTAEVIREDDAYSGVRVVLNGRLATARLLFHVDVNVGDPIWPAPTTVVLPRLLEGTISLVGYPLPMVHAEKLVTAIDRGLANTRWRDFLDIWTLAHRHDVDGDDLASAITMVAEHRAVQLAPLRTVLDEFAVRAQAQWTSWLRKQRLNDRAPTDFGRVLALVCDFGDPALRGDATGRTWSSARLTWAPKPRVPGSRRPRDAAGQALL